MVFAVSSGFRRSPPSRSWDTGALIYSLGKHYHHTHVKEEGCGRVECNWNLEKHIIRLSVMPDWPTASQLCQPLVSFRTLAQLTLHGQLQNMTSKMCKAWGPNWYKAWAKSPRRDKFQEFSRFVWVVVVSFSQKVWKRLCQPFQITKWEHCWCLGLPDGSLKNSVWNWFANTNLKSGSPKSPFGRENSPFERENSPLICPNGTNVRDRPVQLFLIMFQSVFNNFSHPSHL